MTFNYYEGLDLDVDVLDSSPSKLEGVGGSMTG